jgi:hypothetical protein
MNDHDWNAEDVAFIGKAEHVPQFGFSARLASAVVAACLFLLVLYPWNVSYCYPEGNWLPGPLWLFKVQASGDKLIGGLVTAALTPLIFAFVIKPRRLTAAMSIAGILAWVGLGMWLASMAAC